MTKLPARRDRHALPIMDSDAADLFDRFDKIKTVIAGTNPATQAAVLADAVAMFLAGNHPALREQMLSQHIATVRALIPQNERALFGNGYPAGWPHHDE